MHRIRFLFLLATWLPALATALQPADVDKFLGVGAGCNNTAKAAAAGPDGRIYFTGPFTQCGNFRMPAGEGAVYDPRTERFSAIANLDRISLDGAFDEIAFDGNEMFVSGTFSRIGEVAARRVARWDGTRWHALGGLTGADAFTGNQVQILSLELSPFGLYVAGEFERVGGVLANNIAFWHRRSDAWLGLGDPANPGLNGPVRDLETGRDGLYVGGQFVAAGGISAPYVARWDGSSWHDLDSGLVGEPQTATVFALASDGGDVYVSGRFAVARNPGVQHLARWDGGGWRAVGNAALPIQAGGTVFVSGKDLFARGVTGFGNISRFDGTAWTDIGVVDAGGTVQSWLVADSTLYVGGPFYAINGQFIDNVARWNGQSWSGLAVGAPRVSNGPIRRMVSGASSVYLAGNFSDVDGVTASGIARWNGSRWAPLWSGLPPQSTIYDMAEIGGKLYVGGVLTQAGGVPVRNIAVWDGTRWSALGDGIDNIVTSIAGYQDSIYAGGYFANAGGAPVRALARWDGTQWSAVGSGFVGEAGVLSLAVHQSELYVAHQFTHAGGVPAPALARWNGTRWASVDAATANGLTRASRITSNGGDLLIVGADATPGVFRLRESQWSALARLSVGPITASFESVAVSGEQVFLDGRAFTGPRFSTSSAAAHFDGTTWGPLHTPGSAQIVAAQPMQFVTDGGAVSALGFDLRRSGDPQRIPSVSGGGSSSQESSDGLRRVDATTLNDVTQIVLTDRAGAQPQTALVSRNPLTGETGNGNSSAPRLTPDGRFGVFVSSASNLVAGDTNGADDVFLFEYDGQAVIRVQRISTGTYGTQANAASAHPSISDNADFVAFESGASNLVVFDRNGKSDVLIKSVSSGEILRLSATADGQQPNGDSTGAEISSDGRHIEFRSAASNLVAGDTNGAIDAYRVPFRRFSSFAPGPGNDQPGVSGFALPAPTPAFPNCPAGYFIATVDDGPGVGLSPGLFGLELLLDPNGSQRMEGGLNFGGLIDFGQPAFAGFNVQNPANEPQRLDIQLTGYPAGNNGGSLPVKIEVIHQPSAGVNQVVYRRSATLSMAQALVDGVVIQPGFHVVTVLPEGAGTTSAAGPAEGQVFVQLATRFVDRVGGGFFGGVVVGGYHATHPNADVSGFAAFCIATPHNATVRTFSEPEYGVRGANDLRLKLFDYQRREILMRP